MSSKEFKQIILDKLTEILKPRHFKKNGNTFTYINGDLTYFINLQSSQSSTSHVLKCTVNIEIASLSIYKLEDTSLPEKDSRHFTKRIGDYLTPSEDKWWTIEKIEIANTTASAIEFIITNNVLTEFNTIKSTADLVNLWRRNECPGLTEFQRKKYLSLIGEKE